MSGEFENRSEPGTERGRSPSSVPESSRALPPETPPALREDVSPPPEPEAEPPEAVAILDYLCVAGTSSARPPPAEPFLAAGEDPTDREGPGCGPRRLGARSTPGAGVRAGRDGDA